MKFFEGFIQTTRFLAQDLWIGALLSILSGSLYYGVGACLFLMYTYAFNDWVDAPKDMEGHPERAIPSGKISRSQALLISALLFVAGASWTYVFLEEYLLGFSLIYLLSTVYSFVLKPNVALIATPVWSFTFAFLLLQAFTKNPLLYIGATIIIYAYELLLDYRDLESDAKFCKTPTLSNIVGKNIKLVSGVLFVVGIAIIGHSVLS